MAVSNNTDEIDESRVIRRFERLQRENRRLRETVSFRLGYHLTNALRKPWKLVFLPLSFPILCVKIGMERLGKFATNNSERSLCEPYDKKNCTVLFPTNGVGFGHFTRMYAVANELRNANPDMEIIFFTTMPTLHIPYVDNFPTYHLAGKHKFSDMDTNTWNMLVEEMLTLVIETHSPSNFIFDGAFPYRGMLDSIHGREEINKIWMRRGMFKRGKTVPVGSIEHFDLIVHPGDAIDVVDSEIEHNVEVLKTNPVILLDLEKMFTKDVAKNRLGLPADSKVTYVQLGAGQINDIESEIRLTIDALLEHENMRVVVGESMLGKRIEISNERVHLLRDYPNSLYFHAFNYSIQAGGYNSFHEMRTMKIPTLFYPNMNTGMDDQKARCEISVSEGWGIINISRNAKTISKDIKKLFLLDRPTNTTPLVESNGTKTLVERII